VRGPPERDRRSDVDLRNPQKVFGDNSHVNKKKAKTISSQLEIKPGINCWIEGRLTTAPTSISVHRLTTGGTNCLKEMFPQCNINQKDIIASHNLFLHQLFLYGILFSSKYLFIIALFNFELFFINSSNLNLSVLIFFYILATAI
jgi:hypothetical protein